MIVGTRLLFSVSVKGFPQETQLLLWISRSHSVDMLTQWRFDCSQYGFDLFIRQMDGGWKL